MVSTAVVFVVRHFENVRRSVPRDSSAACAWENFLLKRRCHPVVTSAVTLDRASHWWSPGTCEECRRLCPRQRDSCNKPRSSFGQLTFHVNAQQQTFSSSLSSVFSSFSFQTFPFLWSENRLRNIMWIIEVFNIYLQLLLHQLTNFCSCFILTGFWRSLLRDSSSFCRIWYRGSSRIFACMSMSARLLMLSWKIDPTESLNENKPIISIN